MYQKRFYQEVHTTKKKNLRKDFGQKEKEIIPDGKSEIQKKLGKKE